LLGNLGVSVVQIAMFAAPPPIIFEAIWLLVSRS
jgi:hypothetical protein